MASSSYSSSVLLGDGNYLLKATDILINYSALRLEIFLNFYSKPTYKTKLSRRDLLIDSSAHDSNLVRPLRASTHSSVYPWYTPPRMPHGAHQSTPIKPSHLPALRGKHFETHLVGKRILIMELKAMLRAGRVIHLFDLPRQITLPQSRNGDLMSNL